MKFYLEIMELHYQNRLGTSGGEYKMNLNYYFICIIFKFSLIHCLKINELKIDTFFNSPPPIPSKNKDFLDVDVRSDVLPITAEIYDAPTEPVRKHNCAIIYYLV